MYNHAPSNYNCPLCGVVNGLENGAIETKQQDIFYKDKFITAFISSRWWPNNPGHVVIVPNKHFENVYSLPDQFLQKIYKFSKQVTIALKKVYRCQGTSIRQHNEPAGNQDVWHYHLQVFPRYENDNLYLNHLKKKFAPLKVRVVYAQKLENYFKNKTSTST